MHEENPQPAYLLKYSYGMGFPAYLLKYSYGMGFFFDKKPDASSTFMTTFYVLIVSFPLNIIHGIVLFRNETIPAVIAFGDSVFDTGNNDYLNTIVKGNFLPYGRDLTGGKPTGRFSNGKVPPDLLAEAFGVKELLPAYLDQKLQIEDLLTGVSFASGGAGYDPLTAKLVSVLSLSDQLGLFKDYIKKIKTVGEERTASLLSKTLYIVCAGSDDIANTYSSTPFRSNYDIDSYTDLMLNSALSFYKELYGLGARRIGVVNIPAIGCLPSQRFLHGGNLTVCSESVNKATMLFNSKLFSAIDSLEKNLPGSTLLYLDLYNPLVSLVQNPAEYGFEVAIKGCCGTGYFEVGILCNVLEDQFTCKNASKYVFWDSYHPTEKAYRTLVTLILDNAKILL